MKARIDCQKCRKEIYKEAETAYLKNQYAWFKNSAYSMAVFSTVAAIAVMHRRGRSKEYIQQLYEEMCFIYDYPRHFGKQLDMTKLMRQFEREYGIDFSEIKVHLETEEQFIRETKKHK
mgnify:CR=1 FL=1